MAVHPSPSVEQTERTEQAPPLQSGDRLSRAEFERRYQMHPDIKKAELIEGVVYVPSPIHFSKHAAPHAQLVTWLGVYTAATPGVTTGDNATVRLDYENEVQPDALLRLEPAAGGRSSVADDDYLEGAPELVIEIAASSASYDMHDKRRAYARNGVAEYLVMLAYEARVIWYVLQEGVYVAQEPDAAGILRSACFPGLWLNPNALLQGDLATVLATLQQGIESEEHAAFRLRLQAASADAAPVSE